MCVNNSKTYLREQEIPCSKFNIIKAISVEERIRNFSIFALQRQFLVYKGPNVGKILHWFGWLLVGHYVSEYSSLLFFPSFHLWFVLIDSFPTS